MNNFQVLNKLGEGAYSIVYKVKRIIDGNIYALKKVKLLNLSEKEKLNALNEVRILASVKNNFVVSYKEAFFDENETSLGIVMDYADKGDLYQKITEFKKAAVFFEESDIWRIFIQLCKGLKSLHDLKILHRDLKSANVFLYKDGSAKLGDLNVSKVARRGLGYTQTGTPYYASPEIWKDQPYDNKSDIWSLGCVLYEMITLKPPFRAENMEGLYNKVIKGQISKIPDRFSSDIWEIVKMLIQVSPEARPNCDQILKHHFIQKRIEYFKAFTEESEDQCLMQTIRIPKNLLFLSDKLPLPNYENKINNSGELPEIRKINQRKKPKNKDNHQEINDDNSNLSEIQTVNINKKHTRENSNIENNINYNNNNNINNQIKNSNLNINNEEENNIIPNKNKVIDKKERSPSGLNRDRDIERLRERDIERLRKREKERDRDIERLKEREREREKGKISISRKNSGGKDQYNNNNNDQDSSVNIGRKNKNIIEIEKSRSTPKYDLPQLRKKKKEYYNNNNNNNNYKNRNNSQDEYEYKKISVDKKNLKIIKIMPYVNNEHISNMYKIYAPHLKQQQSPIKYNKYNIEKNKNSNNNGGYLKNLEKYYDYYNIYKQMKVINSESNNNNNNNSHKGNIIPNRKLSPIGKHVINL